MDCDHSGTHSGATRYSRKSGQLRLVLVGDQCGAERGVLGQLDYSPHLTYESPPISTSPQPNRGAGAAGATSA